MTTDEWKVLVKAMKAAYPSPNFLPDDWSVKLWYRMLQDIPYETLNLAVQRHISTNRYPPTIADLRGSMVKEKPWSEAWEEVKRSMWFYGMPREREALESMSPLTREIVKRLGYQSLCMSENEAVDRANFRMIYEEEVKRKTEDAALPETVKARLNGILQIGEANEHFDRT